MSSDITLRDTFAAAALTGLIVAMRDESTQEICESAYGWAANMLRERGTAVCNNCSTGNKRETECPVTEPLPKEKRAEVSDRMTLTDEEREAIRIVASVFPSEKHAATLRKLLERLA